MSEQIRIGDTVISTEGDFLEVSEKGYEGVQVKIQNPLSAKDKKTRRRISYRRLECVDLDDGLWQEMVN